MALASDQVASGRRSGADFGAVFFSALAGHVDRSCTPPCNFCRYRKMQQAIYRVRTHVSTQGRLALDLQRDQQAEDVTETIAAFIRHENDPETLASLPQSR
jgi:hypothetical protein